MNSRVHAQLLLQLDERNLAHILSAVTLAALALRSEPDHGEASCCWKQDAFALQTSHTEATLFALADDFVRSLSWVEGLGSTEQGIFISRNEVASNPFISLANSGRGKNREEVRSPYKTFSGQVKPRDLLELQQQKLQSASTCREWLAQMATGVGSWGFDWRVGSHAYDQGYSSNEEGSGDLDPIYPAIEMLSVAGASFFAAVHAWRSGDSTVCYFVWTEPISLSLVPYAAAGLLDGFSGRRYRASNRGAAYGKGAAYRFFPEATIDI